MLGFFGMILSIRKRTEFINLSIITKRDFCLQKGKIDKPQNEKPMLIATYSQS